MGSQAEGPPEVLDPDFRGVFDYPLEELSDVGVRLPIEQIHLLEQCIEGPEQYALTVHTLNDISRPYGWAPPETAWDPEIGQPRLITYPKVVRLDWQAMHEGDTYAKSLALDRNWRRFPSLPGCERDASPWYDETEEGAYEAFRIWNLWPLDASLVEVVEESVMSWFGDEPYQLVETYSQVGRGDYDLCDFAMFAGQGDEDEHEHITDDEAGPINWPRCKTGEQAFADLESHLLVEPFPEDPDFGWWLRWFPGPSLPDQLGPAWSSLLVSSEANSLRALNVFPPWEREEVKHTERMYSPWLWLC